MHPLRLVNWGDLGRILTKPQIAIARVSCTLGRIRTNSANNERSHPAAVDRSAQQDRPPGSTAECALCTGRIRGEFGRIQTKTLTRNCRCLLYARANSDEFGKQPMVASRHCRSVGATQPTARVDREMRPSEIPSKFLRWKNSGGFLEDSLDLVKF